MYDKLSLYGSLANMMNGIAQDEGPKYNNVQNNNSVAAVLANQNKQKQSNLPGIGAQKSNYQFQVQPNNSSIGYLGGDGNWASALTGLTNTFLATKNQKDAEDKQLIGQIIEGIGKGAGGMAMSDKRLKENIRPVGKLDNGLTVYAFNYKGNDTTQIGLIAQEVKKVIPEAVIEGDDGFLRLDYDLATRSK